MVAGAAVIARAARSQSLLLPSFSGPSADALNFIPEANAFS
jgi:hypothetical protein